MPFTNSANMGMPIPQVSQEPGPQYASDVNQCLNMLDAHGHGPGSGNAPPIGSLGINIQSDLSFNIQNAIALRSARFVSTTASSGTDTGCVYVKGVDLFYNDLNGNVVRVTQNGGLSSTGLFTGVISTTAIISAAGPTPATSGFMRMNNNTDFVSWRNAGNNADNNVYFDANDNFIIRGGLGTGPRANNFQLSDTVGSGKVITFIAPLGSSAYSFTPPGQPSSALAPVFMSSSGNLVTGMPVNLNFPGNTVQAGGKNLVVSNTNTANCFGVIRGGTTASNGSTQMGEGYSLAKVATGSYKITISSPFSDVPIAVASTIASSLVATTLNYSSSAFTINCLDSAATATDTPFTFIAIGQR